MALDFSREEIMKRTSLNHVYRIVWSRVLDAWVAVAEITRARGKTATTSHRRLTGVVAALLSLSTALAQAAPAGGQIAAGTGSISQSASTTTVQQGSPKLSVNWASFNVAPQETVNFVQPSAAAIAVNRIFDTHGSQILGQLNANGQVYLINPNGIVFGHGAQVNVGGLVASTLDLNDASLNGDTRRFSGNGNGSVVNRGTINAARGGYIALLGNQVSNHGVISAQLGTVALGAGSAATLTFGGNSLVAMQVDQSVLNSLAENGGLIRADGGTVLMTAGARNALLASVVNNTGVVEARTVEDHAGTIVLLGGMQAGQAQVGGTLDASAPNRGNGGFIETSAAHVKVASDARVTTAAPLGSYGTWLIDPQDFSVAASGGDMSGATLSTNLGSTPVTIQSSGGGSAGSGSINIDDAVSWSADTMLTLTASKHVNVNANIAATGNAAGLAINANTANGGEAASGDGTFNLNNGASVTLSGANPSLGIGGTSYAVINSLGAEGDSSATTMQAMNGNLAGHYALGSDIDATATSAWNVGAGFTPVGERSSRFTGIFDGLGHTISNLAIDLPGSSGVGLFAYGSGSSVVRNVGLVGGSVRGNDAVGFLMGFNEAGSTIENVYATGEVAGTGQNGETAGGLVGSNWGLVSNSYATGNVSGATTAGGLVGWNSSSGVISNSHAAGNVNGTRAAGGLVGRNSGIISNSHAAGEVSGTSDVGGLVGNSGGGAIDHAYATGNVSGSGSHVGGLVGWSDGSTIDHAYATGNVSGSGSHVGGLVGKNGSAYGNTIDNAYATGNVTGLDGVGGLVGTNTSRVVNSYATGKVSGTTDVGGLVGNNASSARLLNSHYDIETVTINGSHALTLGGLYGVQYRDWLSHGMTLDIANYANSLAYDSAGGHYGLNDVQGLKDLLGFADNAAYKFRLTGSIDLAGAPGLWIPDFSGVEFDGAGHTISNLQVDLPFAASVGMFGRVSDASTVRDLGILGGSVVGLESVGGLTGWNKGTISNTYATPSVREVGRIGGAASAGGLVGDNFGTISNSYAAGTVSGKNSVGGLVGYNGNIGTISNSYAAGSVSGMNLVGGLVGYNSGTISNSCAVGSASGINYVGGLVGHNGDYFVGWVSDSFWDTQTSGQATSAAGTGMSTAQMQHLANFTSTTSANGNVNPAWDFAGTWVMYDTHTYPLLRVFMSPLTVSANFSKTYDGLPYTVASGVSYSTPPDMANVLGTVSYDGTAQGARNVGSYAIAPGGLYSNQQGYIISYADSALTITPAPLTYAADAASKTYGQPNPLLSGNVTGLVGSDTLASATTGTATFTTPASSTSNVGSYAVIGSGLTANHGNYLFAQAPANATALTIAPATLTVTADAVDRIYGQANPPLSGNVTGLVGNDTLASATTGTMAFGTPATSSSNVGSYAITGSGLSANHGNYLFAQAPANTTALTIAPATLTVTADPVDRFYGQANPLLSGSISGFVGSDALASATTGTMAFSTPATSSSNVGSYAVIGSGLSANHGNYLFTQAPANATALTIAPATLTVTADAISRIYGQANPLLSGSITGFVGSDTLASATSGTAVFSTPATSSSNVGSYAITGSGLSANFGNYLFAQAPANATALNITPATLTVTADAVDRIYGQANPPLSGNVTGLVGNDTLASATTGTMAFSTPATSTSNVGSYAITGSGLSANFGNYLFAQAPGNATALTITPATLTVTADPVDRIYGQANPLLSGSISGFVGSDTLASATTGTETFSTPATTTSNVGSYAITGSGLSANFGNYLFAQAPANATALTIAPATLTVTADLVDRIYGQANPLFSGSITGFVGSDTLASATTGTETFSTPATSTSNVGSYAITGSGLSANFGNYLFAQAPANATALNITPATLTVTADAVDRIYGQANPPLSGNVTGLVGNDTLASATTGTMAFSTPATSTSNVGSYAITGSGLSANFGNYLFAQAPGNATALTITPATLTVTADPVDRIYGQANPLLSGSISGFVGSDTLASATTGTETFSTSATSASNVGSYAITGSGLSANHGNYLFAQAPGNAPR
jgi:filamentous hemagglutinin family protein